MALTVSAPRWTRRRLAWTRWITVWPYMINVGSICVTQLRIILFYILYQTAKVLYKGCSLEIPVALRVRCESRGEGSCYKCNSDRCNNVGSREYACVQCDSSSVSSFNDIYNKIILSYISCIFRTATALRMHPNWNRLFAQLPRRLTRIAMWRVPAQALPSSVAAPQLLWISRAVWTMPTVYCARLETFEVATTSIL